MHRVATTLHRSLLDLLDSVFAVHGALMQEGDRLGRAAKITSAQWQLLGLLEHGPDTSASMARRRDLRRQSVQETANRLAETGKVRRVFNPADRRAPLLAITAEGKAALEALGAARDAWLAQLGKNVDPSQVESAVDLLPQIRRRLGVPLRDTPHREGKRR